MKSLRIALLLAAVGAMAGCFKLDINVPGPSGGDKGGKKADGRAPTQLPSMGEGSWKDIAVDVAGQLALAAEHGAIFYAYDTLAYPRKPVQLAARLQTTRLKPVEGVTIGFYHGRRFVGAAKTDSGGLAAISWRPPAAGNYNFTAKITQVGDEGYQEFLQISPGPLLVAAHDKEDEFVVLDLDHTVVDSSFFRVLLGGATPMPGSVDATNRIARRYSIVYLTDRPALLTRKSKMWLKRHGYPPGPVMLSELRNAFGDSGAFKTAKLSAVRKSFPNVRIGIGDKPSDAQAYVDNGLAAYLIPHYKEKPKSMRKKASQIERLRGRGRLHVVDDWHQIENGVFQGASFPPKHFARALNRRADRLEAEEKARKRREEDEEADDD